MDERTEDNYVVETVEKLRLEVFFSLRLQFYP